MTEPKRHWHTNHKERMSAEQGGFDEILVQQWSAPGLSSHTPDQLSCSCFPALCCIPTALRRLLPPRRSPPPLAPPPSLYRRPQLTCTHSNHPISLLKLLTNHLLTLSLHPGNNRAYSSSPSLPNATSIVSSASGTLERSSASDLRGAGERERGEGKGEGEVDALVDGGSKGERRRLGGGAILF